MLDSCWHPVPNRHALEWWYFTLLSDDGEVIRGRLWVRGDPSRGLRCGVEVDGYPVGGAPWELDLRHPEHAFHAARDRLLVMVEACSLEQRGEALHLALRHQDLVVRARGVPSIRWEDPTYRYPVGEGGFLWTVPMLRGRFEGLVRRAGRSRELAGQMFVDHVLMDAVPNPDFVWNYRAWWWGLVLAEDWTALSLEVDFRRAPLQVAFVAQGDGPVQVRHGPDAPVRRLGEDPPRFVVERGGRADEVHPTWVARKRHRIPGSTVRQRVLDALPLFRKHHLLGTVPGGSFYAEQLRLR